MKDDVVCDFPLPQVEHQKLVFQTKGLLCRNQRFMITADGRLVQDASCSVAPRLARDLEWPLDDDLHFGWARRDGENLTIVDYVARFRGGRVQWIRKRGDHTDSDPPEVLDLRRFISDGAFGE